MTCIKNGQRTIKHPMIRVKTGQRTITTHYDMAKYCTTYHYTIL